MTYDRARYLRAKWGITKCIICPSCNRLFGLSQGNHIYCADCSDDNDRLNQALFFARKGLMGLGFVNGEALKRLRDDMVSEEGPAFTEFVFGPTCDFVREKKKENMEASLQ
jgi:hypothetical protein